MDSKLGPAQPRGGMDNKMFTGSIQVQLDPGDLDRFPQRIAGVKVWPELGFPGPGQEIGGLRTCGREGSMSKNSLESHIPLG